MGHPYYQNARTTQVQESRIEETARNVASMFRRGLMGRLDAVATLRAAGMFETEIAEALA